MKRVLILMCLFTCIHVYAQYYYTEGTKWTEIRLDTLKYDSWFSEDGQPNYEIQEFYVKGQAELRHGIYYNTVYIKRENTPDSLAFYVKEGIYSEAAIIVKGDLLNVGFYNFDWEERKWIIIKPFLVGMLWGASWSTTIDNFSEEKEGEFGGERPLTYVNATAKVRRYADPKNYILDVCVIKGIGVTSWPGPDCIFGSSDASDAYDNYYSSNDNDLWNNPQHPYRSMLVHFERDGEVLYDVWPSPDGNVVGRTTGLNPSPSPIERGTDAVYDLQGRRLNAVPEKGMYIQGGKKIVKR